MEKEFETKVLQINKTEIVKTLQKLGARQQPELLLRRYVYLLKSKELEWVRLRDNGKNVTLTYKYAKRGNTRIGKTAEIEIEVSSFEKTAKVLSKIPFKKIEYQENKRQSFYLHDIEFSIDTWPMLQPHLEIEGKNIKKVQEGLRLLNLVGKDVGDKRLADIYKENDIDVHAYKRLLFKKKSDTK